MSDSMGAAFRASDWGIKGKGKTGKHKQEGDSPESRESRILLYMSRVHENPEAEKANVRKGVNGRPIALFDVSRMVDGVYTQTAVAGEEYSEEELKVVPVEDDCDSDDE